MIRNAPIKCLGLMLCVCLTQGRLWAQSFSDLFAGRQLLTNAAATLTGSNTNATVEPGEPLHAGKIGGHSLWISWQAPANGLATLSTAGSSFDTLLAVYNLESGDDPPLRRLETTAYNDDYGGVTTSYLQFGANAGQTYQIAVDGFNGATGDVLLQLNLLTFSNLQPTTVGLPGDQSLRIGDPLILTINLVPSPNLQFRWFLNGAPVAGQDDDSTAPTLVIPSLQRTNLGLYSLKFYLDDDSFFSSAIEIQVNSEGLSQVLARNKLPDAAQSGLVARGSQTGLGGGVILGYNGTQIFNTSSAIVDPNAPLVCGVAPGAAYWFAYQAPTNGLMTLTTGNSSFATLLAVFTYTGALTSYANLIPVACDNNNGGTGTGTSSVQFTTATGANYYIVVGGVNGASGIAHLNYSLGPGLPPVPPILTSQPRSLVVVTQTAVSLTATAGGSLPLSYQWWKDNSPVRHQTNSSLLLRSPQIQDAGNYSLVVTNFAGAVTSAPATVTVLSAPTIRLDPAAQTAVSAFPAVRGFQYSVDYAANPVPSFWAKWTNLFPDYGGVIWLTNSTQNSGVQLQRVHTP